MGSGCIDLWTALGAVGFVGLCAYLRGLVDGINKERVRNGKEPLRP